MYQCSHYESRGFSVSATYTVDGVAHPVYCRRDYEKVKRELWISLQQSTLKSKRQLVEACEAGNNG